MRPSELLPQHREIIRELVRQAGIANPRIFGSVLHGEDREDSDLDILVDPAPRTSLLDLRRPSDRDRSDNWSQGRRAYAQLPSAQIQKCGIGRGCQHLRRPECTPLDDESSIELVVLPNGIENLIRQIAKLRLLVPQLVRLLLVEKCLD